MGQTRDLPKQAFDYHQAGDLANAEALYLKILEDDPHHVDITFLLGTLYLQSGNPDAAITFLKETIKLKPDHAIAHSRLGIILQEQGKFDESIKSLKRAIALDPANVDIHNNLGTVLTKLGKLDEAVESYNRAIKLNPEEYRVYSNLASALKESGKLEEALINCNKAIKLNPHYAEVHNNLGAIFQETNQPEKAIVSYKNAIELKPDNHELYSNLGSALKELNRLDEAAGYCRHAIMLKPDYAEAYNNLGTILQEEIKFDEAITNYKQAINIKPDHARAHSNLGTTLQEQGNTEEALLYCHQAVTLDPDSAELHNNLGAILQKQEMTEEAITSYDMAIELDPDYAEAHLNKSFALLLTGNYKEGWIENEWRLRTKTHSLRNFNKPKWNGSPLNGKTILVHAEQGFGDTIQFIRYLPMVKAQGGQVIFECHKSLNRLLKNYAGIDEIIEKTSEPDIKFDTQLPILSLPGVFGTTQDSIPSGTPYITADPGLEQLWSLRLDNDNDFKVGIVWAGNADNKKDHIRSCALVDFSPLLKIEGTVFYSIQKGPASSEANNLPGGMKVINLNDQITDFADTAAVIANLDLIISVDTAVVHLAGALGKPVWNLLHFAPDWRWLLNRDDSPWYPEMRLFRQSKLNDWTDLFKKVKEALLQKVNGSEMLTTEHNEYVLQHSDNHC
ncbi:MAG: tetratricopeptide repeat protein [Candidatus Scalindua sp.]|nr:tetratricopeptide repeat protein [Candidatus Scalindua sp.]MCR4345435.1 tetratricopeptide repeat protein [Candidatus Scalindua sp.]